MTGAVLEELSFEGEDWIVLAYPLARPAVLAELTASELAVIDCWLAGLSMRAVARERGVSVRTIANQLASAYRKLGVSSRVELVALFQDQVP